VTEAQSPTFFLSPAGTRVTGGAFNGTFRTLIKQAGLEGRGQRARPRAHDIRHSFAVQTLIDWYRDGEDIDRQMPVLSTFLGHVDPVSTYWYLEASPELLALARDRLERGAGRPS
jgi:integrase